MIINVTYPSRFKRRNLYFKTKKYFQNHYKEISKDQSEKNKETINIFIKKESLNLIFNEDDAESIKFLRGYINYIFCDSIVGVDYSNLITAQLENVTEYVY